MRKFRHVVIALLFILGMLSCSKNSQVKEIIKDTKSASFAIYMYDEFGRPKGSGSGFFIDPSGVGITNYHVLDGSVKAIIKTSDSIEYEINEVLASNKNKDLLKFNLKTDKKDFNYLSFASNPVEQGDVVYNISAPMGLEYTVSNGIVSCLRKDSHGNVAQITAPISPGSSGSALLNEDGDVFAVAAFQMRSGQNLNFGVIVNDQVISELTDNEFKKNNSKFNKKEDFVILNIPSDADRNSVLNAIEFKDDATIAYISYTNLDLQNPEMQVWTEVNKGTDGFYIKDHRTDRIHTAISSSIGTSKSSLTSVPIATTLKFKVNFPPIKDRENLGLIDLVEGPSNSSWKFTDIDLSKYRNQLVKFDTKAYQKDYAYSLMQNGDWAESMSILNSILDEDPDDEQALNTLGIISYVLKNYTNANLYFTRAIEAHPNSINGYMNRCWLYVENGDKKSALDDLSAAVGIDNRYYYRRAMLYESMEDYANAKQDYSNYLSQVSLDNDEKARVYYNRALCNLNLKLTDECTKDLKKAYELTSDPQLKKALKPYVTAATASSSSKKYEFFSNGSFRITKCSVGITDYNSNIITNYGAPLYSSKTKYLKPKLEIKSNVSGNYKIYYRFFNPDGTLSTGSNSPSGYSSYSEISLYKGSVTQYLLGWGSNNPGHWKPGNYKYEFFDSNGKNLGYYKFTIK